MKRIIPPFLVLAILIASGILGAWWLTLSIGLLILGALGYVERITGNEWPKKWRILLLVLFMILSLGNIIVARYKQQADIRREGAIRAQMLQQQKQKQESDREILRLSTEAIRLKLEITEAQKATEQERLARLKIEERVANRRLTEAQQERIARKLSVFAGRSINVLIYRGDVEAWSIADQIKLALGGKKGAGWIVHSARVAEFNRAFSGMLVETTAHAGPEDVSAANALVSALSAETLVVRGPIKPTPELRWEAHGNLDTKAGVHLVVGTKP